MTVNSAIHVDREYAKICVTIDRLASNREVLPGDDDAREYVLQRGAKLIAAMGTGLTADDRMTLIALAALVRRQSMVPNSRRGASRG